MQRGGKLVRLEVHRGEKQDAFTVTEKYTLTMITDGLVACGLIRPEERANARYQLARTSQVFGADQAGGLGALGVKTGDRLYIIVEGERRHEQRSFRRLA